MKEEFKLSKKKYIRPVQGKEQGVFKEEDVKKFIKILEKEEDSYDLQSAEAIQFRNAMKNYRRKKAGEKLT